MPRSHTALDVRAILPSLALFASLLVSPAQADASALVEAPDPASLLTRDVQSIASAGVPGPLAAFGDHAFPIVSGKLDKSTSLPVAVGAVWDRGRVVALGHGGMIGAKALEHAGTRRFVANCIRWMTQHHEEHAAPPRVAVRSNDAMIALLRELGFDARPLAGNQEAWAASLAQMHAVVIDSHQINDAARPILAAYVKSGGGLLTAGLGWGWLQLNPDRTIHSHPGNLLLREAGIAWCDDTLDPTGDDAFLVNDVAPMLHAGRALEALDEEASDPSRFDHQGGATLSSVLRTLPREHEFFARAERFLDKYAGEIHVSEKSPLRRSEARKRVAITLQREVETLTPAHEVRAHPSSSEFPGLVPHDAPRITREIEIDRTVPDWHSTGLYAPPGEVIELTSRADPSCFRVRIGCHSDTLWHHDTWRRIPDISRVWNSSAFTPADGDIHTARLCSPLGGLIYIDVTTPLDSPDHDDALARFTISNAVAAPRFILGRSTQEQWLASRDAPAPWGELESSKVILSVPSAALRELDDPAPLMEFWNAISDAHATLATIPTDPRRPHRFVADVQISAGYMHAGYPIMTHLDAVKDMTSLERLKRGPWGLLHELGHNHQHSDWTFDGTVEVTCNLFTLHAIDTLCTPTPGSRGHKAVDTPPDWASYIRRGADFREWKRDPFLALHMYVQLERAFGWDTFKKVFSEYRSLPRDQRPRNDDEKRDQWMVRFSRAAGRDLSQFFTAWGVPTSESARASLADLPRWMPENWPGN